MEAEITEIKVGSKLRDNDKRQKGRIVVVTEVLDFGESDPNLFVACYHTGKRQARIRFDRIFTDGKKRQRGFNLVKPDAVT